MVRILTGYVPPVSGAVSSPVYVPGVAVASVTDWKSYNEWYTRRRLGLVKDDKDIFDKTSPISYSGGLQDNLLMVHGIMDDNVLFQNSLQMMDALERAGKLFQLVLYTQKTHGVTGSEARHVDAAMLGFFQRALK